MPDPEGVALPLAALPKDRPVVTGIPPFQGRTLLRGDFRGRCPRLLNVSPARIKDGHRQKRLGSAKGGQNPIRYALTKSLNLME